MLFTTCSLFNAATLTGLHGCHTPVHHRFKGLYHRLVLDGDLMPLPFQRFLSDHRRATNPQNREAICRRICRVSIRKAATYFTSWVDRWTRKPILVEFPTCPFLTNSLDQNHRNPGPERLLRYIHLPLKRKRIHIGDPVHLFTPPRPAIMFTAPFSPRASRLSLIRKAGLCLM